MWIRSQDKTKIVKTDRIDVVVNTIRCCNGDDSIFMGEYSNTEKALKVLDMIEKHLVKMYVGAENYMGKPFQMPQDDEV